MRSRSPIAAIFLLLMIFVTPGAKAQGDSAPSAETTGKWPGKWIDEPLQNWNEPPLTIPSGNADSRGLAGGRCGKEVRTPQTQEDHQVTRAGWALVAPA